MTDNPYVPPKASVADVADPSRESPRPLWNPRVAFYWSLLLSPAFGAFLHMKNWEALERPDKIAASRNWFLVIVLLLLAFICTATFVPTASSRDLSRFAGFFLLLAWYYGIGRSQVFYVKSNFGKAYPRRGWLLPIVCAVFVVIALIVALSAIILVAERLFGLGLARP